MTELPRSWAKHSTVLAKSFTIKASRKSFKGDCERIIDAVKNGERDPIRLRNAGLAAFGAKYEKR